MGKVLAFGMAKIEGIGSDSLSCRHVTGGNLLMTLGVQEESTLLWDCRVRWRVWNIRRKEERKHVY